MLVMEKYRSVSQRSTYQCYMEVHVSVIEKCLGEVMGQCHREVWVSVIRSAGQCHGEDWMSVSEKLWVTVIEKYGSVT